MPRGSQSLSLLINQSLSVSFSSVEPLLGSIDPPPMSLAAHSVGLAASADLVLELEGGQALVVEDLADVAAVEVEVSVAEVHEGDASSEKKQPRVVSLALRLERIVTELVTVGQVVHVVLLFEGVAARIA